MKLELAANYARIGLTYYGESKEDGAMGYIELVSNLVREQSGVSVIAAKGNSKPFGSEVFGQSLVCIPLQITVPRMNCQSSFGTLSVAEGVTVRVLLRTSQVCVSRRGSHHHIGRRSDSQQSQVLPGGLVYLFCGHKKPRQRVLARVRVDIWPVPFFLRRRRQVLPKGLERGREWLRPR